VLNVEFRFALNGITFGEGQWATVQDWLKSVVLGAVQNVQADSESLANVVAESYQARRAAAEDGLFSPAAAAALLKLDALSTKDFDDFVANPFLATGALAAIPFTEDDRRTLMAVGEPLFLRAAALTAVNVSAAVLRTGEGRDPLHPVCVTIDGSTYYKTRTAMFKSRVEQGLRDGPLGISEGPPPHLEVVDRRVSHLLLLRFRRALGRGLLLRLGGRVAVGDKALGQLALGLDHRARVGCLESHGVTPTLRLR
jgi:hypothetical protein